MDAPPHLLVAFLSYCLTVTLPALAATDGQLLPD